MHVKFDEDAFSKDLVDHPTSILSELVSAPHDEIVVEDPIVPCITEIMTENYPAPPTDDSVELHLIPSEVPNEPDIATDNSEAELVSTGHAPHMSYTLLHHPFSKIIGDIS